MKSKFEAIKNIILKKIPEAGLYSTAIKGVKFVRRDKS